MLGDRYEVSDLSVVMGKDAEGNMVIGMDVGKVDSRSDPGARSMCAVQHHRISQHVVYADGVVTGFCTKCEERVEIPRIPGGMPVLEAQALLDAVLGATDGEDPILMFGVSEKIKALHEDLRAYQDALLLLDGARALLVKRVLEASS